MERSKERSKEYEELTRRPVPDETMPSREAESDHHSDENVAPANRERFTSLLNAAARKREQED